MEWENYRRDSGEFCQRVMEGKGHRVSNMKGRFLFFLSPLSFFLLVLKTAFPVFTSIHLNESHMPKRTHSLPFRVISLPLRVWHMFVYRVYTESRDLN